MLTVVSRLVCGTWGAAGGVGIGEMGAGSINSSPGAKSAKLVRYPYSGVVQVKAANAKAKAAIKPVWKKTARRFSRGVFVKDMEYSFRIPPVQNKHRASR